MVVVVVLFRRRFDTPLEHTQRHENQDETFNRGIHT